MLALALLGGGFLYLGKYEASLIGQQIESLKTQGEVFAAALGEGAVLDSADEGEVLLPDLARQMMRRLVAPTKTRARLFDVHGEIIADSRVLRGPGGAIQVSELPPADTKGPRRPARPAGLRLGRPNAAAAPGLSDLPRELYPAGLGLPRSQARAARRDRGNDPAATRRPAI